MKPTKLKLRDMTPEQMKKKLNDLLFDLENIDYHDMTILEKGIVSKLATWSSRLKWKKEFE